jgi:hypothetical protein
MLMEAETDLPGTKGELIQRIESDWAPFASLVSSLTDSQLTTPGPEVWAPKDHVVHIAEWERGLAALLAGRLQSEGFRFDEATSLQLAGDVEAINSVLYERNRALGVSEVLAISQEAHTALMEALGRLTDGEIHGTVAGFGMDLEDHRPLAAGIGEDSFGHYAEHAGWIREMVGEPSS